VPTRRTFELVVITAVLLQPALAMVRVWMRKHIAVTGGGPTAQAAAIIEEIL